MSDAASPSDNRVIHLIALAAGLFAVVLFIFGPVGLIPQVLILAVGVVAVIIGHRASARRGSIRWAAILGLVVAYIQVITAAGILLVGAIRVLSTL